MLGMLIPRWMLGALVWCAILYVIVSLIELAAKLI